MRHKNIIDWDLCIKRHLTVRSSSQFFDNQPTELATMPRAKGTANYKVDVLILTYGVAASSMKLFLRLIL
jgi:hypothetical protein